MTDTTLVKSARTVVAAGTSAAVGSPVRSAIDTRTGLGGTLTLKINNGATGPTLPLICTVMIAHSDGAVPATGAEGATWKYLWSFSGSVANNGLVRHAIPISKDVQHLQVEFKDNTGQAVTCEAFFSETTKALSI